MGTTGGRAAVPERTQCHAGAGAQYRAADESRSRAPNCPLPAQRQLQDGSPVAQRGRNDSGHERRTDVPRAPQAEFRQGLARKATRPAPLTQRDRRLAGLPAVRRHRCATVSRAEDRRPKVCGRAACPLAGIPSMRNRRDQDVSVLYLRSMTPIRDRSPPTKNPCKSVHINQSGRPDLNRGPHRPELWATSGARCTKYLQIDGFPVSPAVPSGPRISPSIPGV